VRWPCKHITHRGLRRFPSVGSLTGCLLLFLPAVCGGGYASCRGAAQGKNVTFVSEDPAPDALEIQVALLASTCTRMYKHFAVSLARTRAAQPVRMLCAVNQSQSVWLLCAVCWPLLCTSPARLRRRPAATATCLNSLLLRAACRVP
jgi:hypothetical protein